MSDLYRCGGLNHRQTVILKRERVINARQTDQTKVREGCHTGDRIHAHIGEAGCRAVSKGQTVGRGDRSGDGVGRVSDQVAVCVAHLKHRLNVQRAARSRLVSPSCRRRRLSGQRDVVAVSEGERDASLLSHCDCRVGGRERDGISVCGRTTQDQAREGCHTGSRRHLSEAHQAAAGRSRGANDSA